MSLSALWFGWLSTWQQPNRDQSCGRCSNILDDFKALQEEEKVEVKPDITPTVFEEITE